MCRIHSPGAPARSALYCLLLAPPASLGQAPADDPSADSASSLETIVVTGTQTTLTDAQGDLALTPGGADLVDMVEFRDRDVSSMADGLPVTTADGSNHNRVVDPLSARYAVVAHGANALKYGASTLGGAINFASPTARDFPAADLSVSTGSHGQTLARATLSREFDERRDALLTLEGKQWDGYREHNDHRRVGIYANAGWRLSEDIASRFYGTYLENDQQLPGALTRAAAEASRGRANPAAVGGDYQRDVEAWRLANKTTWQMGSRRRLEFGFSAEEQNLFHPIVDQIFADLDGPGPAPPVEVFSLRWRTTWMCSRTSAVRTNRRPTSSSKTTSSEAVRRWTPCTAPSRRSVRAARGSSAP